jgi:hypothetical protein
MTAACMLSDKTCLVVLLQRIFLSEVVSDYPPETNGLLRREDGLMRLEGFRDERDYSPFTVDGSCPQGAAYGFLMIRLVVPRGQLLEVATGKRRRTAWC